VCRGRGGLLPQQAHWHIVTLDGSVPDDEVLELIGHAYDLVVAHLTKAQQSMLIT
jgi:predicted DNA-binding protein (MmcQ/YjbR family)